MCQKQSKVAMNQMEAMKAAEAEVQRINWTGWASKERLALAEYSIN